MYALVLIKQHKLFLIAKFAQVKEASKLLYIENLKFETVKIIFEKLKVNEKRPLFRPFWGVRNQLLFIYAVKV